MIFLIVKNENWKGGDFYLNNISLYYHTIILKWYKKIYRIVKYKLQGKHA